MPLVTGDYLVYLKRYYITGMFTYETHLLTKRVIVKQWLKKTLQLGELVSEDDNGENNNQPYINITISYFNPCPLS